ncbi:hypothetical protein SLEP1_g33893 [Rubroshorea leprosula]|uniref:Reverse transcriptase Ty1/copia-type domain-containing protein n=1 Tax=Rubroshorea leprosula TaxID=152421 RepID=A0AAV5KI17_9ROSI|nr:hypothetical protein SLEP1_g33893 [Rubroshorea leprosula]
MLLFGLWDYTKRISLLGSCVTKTPSFTSCCLLGTHYVLIIVKLQGTFDEFYNASQHASTSSVEDDLHVGNTLDNSKPSSTSSFVSPVDVAFELVVPSSSHPTQEHGIDYEKTFALVARLTSVHSLLAIIAIRRWKLFHMDVKNAFLNGLEVTSSNDGYLLSQVKCASDLISKAELNDVYLTTTCPDIAYAVHIVSQFMAAPRSTHYAAVLCIIRYVKGTLFHGLHFSAKSFPMLRAYSDADWACDPSDCRSTTGYCLFLGNSLIS